MKKTLTIKQDTIRKVRNKNLFRVTVEVINDTTGAIRLRSFLEPTKGMARSSRSMFLRNVCQGKVSHVNI